jgi:hypothetical protein
MRPAFGEREPGADDELLHGSRHEHLSRPGERRHARADVDGETSHLIGAALDLAGVETGANLQAETAHAVADGAGARHRAGRAVETGKDPVPRGVHFASPKALDLAAHEPVVLLEKIVPLPVAEIRADGDGTIVGMALPPVVLSGYALFHVGRIEDR